MSRVRYKLLFLLLLLIPELLFARRPCCRLQLAGWWAEVDYLLIWRKGRFYPPLVTTSPLLTPINESGVLGQPGTSILFGETIIRESPKSGVRVDAGLWVLRCLGFGTTYISAGSEKIKFRNSSDEFGIPILARPFFNTNTNVQDSRVVSHPLLGPGNVNVDAGNRFWISDCYARYRLCCCNSLIFDILGGFMYTEIDDVLDISAHSSFGLLGAISFQSDHFKTRNDFYAGLIGFLLEYRMRCATLQVIAKAGIGNMVEKVEIEGMSIIGGFPINAGLLANASNSGDHSGRDFQVVPRVLADLQFKIYPHLWWKLGYMFIFWPKVALAGDQVNLNVGIGEPIFRPKSKCFWAQGFMTGFYVCF